MTDSIEPAARHHAHESHPPERPTELTRRALQFTRMPATRWLNPGVLVVSGLRHALTTAFGSFLDKRELQANIAAEPDVRYAERSELWLDYLADTGDGFDSTYAMASLLARRELTVDVHDDPTPLRRGQLLVLGGDEVYPVATTDNYEQRLSGPFRAALPWTVGDHPSLYALPGNHDWYDGLTGFLRLFGQHRWIGGWKTLQTRSYFAVQLPHRWWLWGMDVQPDQYVDEPQLRYFAEVLERSRPGDKLVLATADPSWIETERHREAFRNVAYVDRSLLQPHGVELKLAIAGNLHHYARYTHLPVDASGDKAVETGAAPVDDNGRPFPPPPRHLLTVGGGGAFLHPTHDLPRRLRIPAEPGLSNRRHGYGLERTYPTTARSRRLAWSAVLLPFRNPGFLWIGAVVHVTFLWTNQFGLRSLSRGSSATYAASAQRSGWQDIAFGLVRNPLAAVTLMLLALGLMGLARRPPWVRRRSVEMLWRAGLGLLHTAAHVVALVLVALLSIGLAADLYRGGWFVVTTSVLAAGIGAVVAGLIVGVYFAIANTVPKLRIHGNEAFSAARLSMHRSFLRLHLDEDGKLNVYALGVERVPKRWRPDNDTFDPERSWLIPDGEPIEPHLIEKIVVE